MGASMSQTNTTDYISRNCMRYLPLFLVFISFTRATPTDVYCIVTSYGVTTLDGKQITVDDSRSPTSRRRVVEAAEITNVTNRVSAKMGVSFGIAYQITNIPLKDGAIIEVERSITFPSMKKPDGSTVNSYSGTIKLAVKNGRVAAQTGYTFEYNYELVPGIWEFALSFEHKTLCKQSFMVSVE
jgi:hypothetical protein